MEGTGWGRVSRAVAREAVKLMEAHRPFVRALVVHVVGSVPGKLWASMIVRDDGTTLGTIGGAILEERIKDLAAESIRHGTGGLHHFDLQRWKTGGLPSLCGGAVDIALEYVPARPNLLLWGGGHVAQALAQLLPALEYDLSVADDRADWVGPDRFPGADRRAVVAPEHLWDVFEPREFSHLYLLGYDALKDLTVLERSLTRFPGQIGVIASASKREHMFATLRAHGVQETALGRVRSPVGLAIGAQTPQEIAVSIAAELILGQHPGSPATTAEEPGTVPMEADVATHAP
jgi:xanthine dehydrogenase accessory factor